MSSISVIDEIVDSLEDIKYGGSLADDKKLIAAAELGPISPDFTALISHLTMQLSQFYELDERVNPATDSDEKSVENFLFEMSGFLQEYGCPYEALISGDIGKRFSNKDDCLTLILFLTSEVQAAQIYFTKNPNSINAKKDISNCNGSEGGDEVFQDLKKICIALNMSKPPNDIAVDRFFTGIENKLTEVARKLSPDRLGHPVIKKQFGPWHWDKLHAINRALVAEYTMRRAMLLKRVDVTIASFNWSDRAKAKVNDIAEVYQKQRHRLKSDSTITIAHLLAAREDLSQICKTAAGNTRHACAINRVIMGRVPDRGGRTDEIEAPPPEMPSWQKRQDDGGRGGYRGGGRGGQRGGGGGGYGGGQGNRGRGGGNRGGYYGHDDRPYSAPGDGGGRVAFDNRPQSGGYRGGGNQQQQQQQSRWGRGGGGPGRGGSFQQHFGRGGQQYGHGGFASGRQQYYS